jgi:hypothetical protein
MINRGFGPSLTVHGIIQESQHKMGLNPSEKCGIFSAFSLQEELQLLSITWVDDICRKAFTLRVRENINTTNILEGIAL